MSILVRNERAIDLEDGIPAGEKVSASAPEQPTNIEDIAQEVTIRKVAPLVIVLTGATFVTTISIQAVVIILPAISKDLDIPETRQQWVISAYALTSGSFLLLFGKLADIYGKRMIFILGCFAMAAFALGAAFSTVEVCLYIMRALQGLGAAMVVPTAIGIIGYTIPPGRVKNYAFAFYSGGAPTGQAVGNILGGVLSQYTTWKAVFLVVAGASFLFGALAIAVIPKEAARLLEASKSSQTSRIDWLGAFLFTSGFLLALIGVSEGVSEGWKNPLVITCLVVSAFMLLSFGFWAHYLETIPDREPLMRVSTFKNTRFSIALTVIALFSAGFTNYLVYSTYYYQDYQHLSSLQTTYRFLPLGMTGFLTAICSGYLLALIRGDFLLTFGLLSAFCANLIFALPLPPSASYFATGFPAMILAAFGADTIFPCLGLFTTQCLPRGDQALAGAMFQTASAVGRAIFLPVTAAVQEGVQGGEARRGRSESEAFLSGLRAVEWFCVACMAVSLGLTIGGLRGMGTVGMKKKLGD